MKLLFNTLIATSVLSFALTAHAKIGDTFIDPELGKITVKGPSFENDKDGMVFDLVNGKHVVRQTPEYKLKTKASNATTTFETLVRNLPTNMSEKDIIKVTQGFIQQFKILKELRKEIYINGYNEQMLFQYTASIKNGLRELEYKFVSYLIKIKGTPEYKQLIEEIRFAMQTLEHLKLYEQE